MSKGERTRQAILTAAVARFGRDGYRAASVAEIGRDAGVSGSLAYAYFADKEALFLVALDEDAAAVIREGLSHLLDSSGTEAWHETLILTLVEALDRHPLARRVLAGLEPDVTERVIEIPAMLELRKAVANKLRAEQLDGVVRSDIDPVAVGNGTVSIILSLLMSVLQLGPDTIGQYAPDIWAVFSAAIDPPAR